MPTLRPPASSGGYTLMVTATSAAAAYRTLLTNGRVETTADAMKGGVGSSNGFRPHELLEAAVAACMNISARLKADDMGVAPVEVATEVALDRSDGRAVFRGRVRVAGELTDAQRTALEEAAFHCPVGRTLLRECILLKEGEEMKAPGATGERRSADPTRVSWNAADYHAHACAQSAWGRELHARIALRPDEVVFDLGCGDGRLTAELADRLPAGRVYGLDADGDMIAFARRTHARDNVVFVEGDVRMFSFADRASLIVSSACLHWVAEHELVLRRCRDHLEPGGRILFQMGGRGNCGEILAAAAAVAAEPAWSPYLEPFTAPWSFYGPEDYQAWLPRSGFRSVRAELRPKDMIHEGREAVVGWIRTTWMPVLDRLPEAARADFIAQVVTRYQRDHPADARGRTHVAAVRLEIEAEAV
jgi:trans-aconitate 2-methyltransferase